MTSRNGIGWQYNEVRAAGMRGVRDGAVRGTIVICKACGTEIADKALICYRCGEATAEVRVKPPTPRARRLAPVAISVAVLLVAGLYTLYMVQTASDSASQPLIWMLVGLALVALIWRVWAR